MHDPYERAEDKIFGLHLINYTHVMSGLQSFVGISILNLA
jgi:hypothetical protein